MMTSAQVSSEPDPSTAAFFAQVTAASRTGRGREAFDAPLNAGAGLPLAEAMAEDAEERPALRTPPGPPP
jgi:hypothetical protein